MTQTPRSSRKSTKRTRTTRKTQLLDDSDRSESTNDAYRFHFDKFDAWCRSRTPRQKSLPAHPRTVTRYLYRLRDQGKKTATISLVLTAISQTHERAGHLSPRYDPNVRATWKAIQRQLGLKQKHMTPIIAEDIRTLISALQSDNYRLVIRDQLLILLGFVGALTRAELVALDIEDIKVTRRGLEVFIKKSQTDQAGKGAIVAVPKSRHKEVCPLVAYKAWLSASGIAEGPLFRPVDRHGNVRPARLTSRAIGNIVKRTVIAAGLDPDKYSGHSLRSGLAISAAQAGHADQNIAEHVRLKDYESVRRYSRAADPWRQNVADGLL